VASSSNYQAWVEVVPEFKGFNKSVNKNVTDSLGAAGDAGGKTFGGKLAGALGAIAKPIAVAGGVAFAGIGAAAGLALTKGLDRSLSIQDATAKLTGLGHSGESVQTIMNSALASVKGTAFGLGDAAGVAAGAVAAGIEPGEKLTRVLSLMADSATIAGTDLGSMGSIFNKVAASGKLQGDVIAQLQDAGVPVLQFVAKQMGVTAEEAATLASQGKVSFATFSDAMESGLGGAALSSGKTARGAFANLGAALGRFGAMFTTPLVAAAPAFFGKLTGAIDGLAAQAQPFADKFATWVGPAVEKAGTTIANFINGDPSKLEGFFAGIGDAVQKVGPYLPALASGFADFGSNVGSILGPAIKENLPGLQNLAQSLLEVATTVLPELLPALGDLVLAILPILPAILPLITTALPPLIDLLNQLVQPSGDTSGLDAVVIAVGGLATAVGFLLTLLPGPLVLLPQLVSAFQSTEGAANLVEQVMSGKLGPVIQAIGGFIFALATTFRNALTAIRSTVETGVDAVKAAFNRVFNSLPSPVRNALAIIGSVISGGIGGAVSTISSLGPRAVSALGNTGSLLVGAGRNLVDGFIAGMVGGIGRVAARAAELANAARTAAERALDINSPSRVFRDEIGMMVGLGMAEGIDRSAAKVKQSMADLAGVPDIAARSYAFDSSVAGSSVGGDTYVQNPFTGEYLLAKQEQVAGQAVAAYDATSSMSDRMGRQRAGR
jgi:tape measure domain-containing protein